MRRLGNNAKCIQRTAVRSSTNLQFQFHIVQWFHPNMYIFHLENLGTVINEIKVYFLKGLNHI